MCIRDRFPLHLPIVRGGIRVVSTDFPFQMFVPSRFTLLMHKSVTLFAHFAVITIHISVHSTWVVCVSALVLLVQILSPIFHLIISFLILSVLNELLLHLSYIRLRMWISLFHTLQPYLWVYVFSTITTCLSLIHISCALNDWPLAEGNSGPLGTAKPSDYSADLFSKIPPQPSLQLNIRRS